MDGTFFICNKKVTSSLWVWKVHTYWFYVYKCHYHHTPLFLSTSIFNRYFSSYVDCGMFDIHRKQLLTSDVLSVHHLWSYLSRFYSAKVLFIPSSLFLAVYPTFLYCTFICSPIFVLFGFLLYLPVSRQSSFHWGEHTIFYVSSFQPFLFPRLNDSVVNDYFASTHYAPKTKHIKHIHFILDIQYT